MREKKSRTEKASGMKDEKRYYQVRQTKEEQSCIYEASWLPLYPCPSSSSSLSEIISLSWLLNNIPEEPPSPPALLPRLSCPSSAIPPAILLARLMRGSFLIGILMPCLAKHFESGVDSIRFCTKLKHEGTESIINYPIAYVWPALRACKWTLLLTGHARETLGRENGKLLWKDRCHHWRGRSVRAVSLSRKMATIINKVLKYCIHASKRVNLPKSACTPL